MNILYIADSASWHNAKWTEYFAENTNHKVILFSDLKPDYKKVHFHKNVKLVEMPSMIDFKSRHINKITSILMYKKAIENIIKKEKIDIIHTVALYYAFLASYLKTDLSIIYTPQGSELLMRAQNNRLYSYMARRVFKRVDVITGDSRAIQNAGFLFGAKKEKNYIIQNGVDLNIFNPSVESIRSELGAEEDTLLLYSPRAFDPLYNIPDIIECLRILKDQQINFKCMFAYAFGEQYLNQYKKMIKKFGLEDYIIWNGYTDHEDMPKYYKSADIVLSVPSSDSSPKTVYESMACGTPVVVTNLAWTQEHLVEDEHIVKVNVNKPDEIARAILKITNDSKFKEQLSKNGIEIVKELYSYHDNMKKMETIMENEIVRKRTL